jgi:hypothetical protein
MPYDQNRIRQHRRWLANLANIARACRAVELERGTAYEAMAKAWAGDACARLDRTRPPVEWLWGLEWPTGAALGTRALDFPAQKG